MKAAAFRTVTYLPSDLHMACGETKHLCLSSAWFDQAEEQLKRRVFPAPFAPSNANTSPGWISRLKFCSAVIFRIFAKSLGDQRLCLLCFHDH